ncbi:MAG: hypothetical protein HZA94_00005 [Candidatus Vogelbacteria bacterium]|nr:hypothetical protein [Candidatus Vogelbacteria bacterium]
MFEFLKRQPIKKEATPDAELSEDSWELKPKLAEEIDELKAKLNDKYRNSFELFNNIERARLKLAEPWVPVSRLQREKRILLKALEYQEKESTLLEHISKKAKDFIYKYPETLLPVAIVAGLSIGELALAIKTHLKNAVPVEALTAKDLDSFENIKYLGGIKDPKERAVLLQIDHDIQFGEFDGYVINSKTVEMIVRYTLPKGFAGNLSKIDYRDEIISTPERYGISGNQGARATIELGSVEVSKGSTIPVSIIFAVDDLLTHEIGHLNWTGNKFLTTEEKQELLTKIVERVRSTGRYKSSYVEKINNDNKREELDLKVTEYFAEIASAYFSPTQHYLLPTEDAAIIDELIAKTDPNFDIKKARKRRTKIILMALKKDSEQKIAIAESQIDI